MAWRPRDRFLRGAASTPIEYKGLLPVGYFDPAKREKAIERAGTKYLEVIEKAAKAAGVSCKVEQAVSECPAAIVAAAKKNKYDHIVLASHGHRGFKNSLPGSQTQKVLSLSKVPVLVHR